MPKLILPSNMEIERDLAPFGHSPSPSPSPSPQPPIDYDVEVDPDNMVIRGGGDAYDTEIDPDNMVVPGSRAVTPNYDDEGVYQAHTWVRSHAPWTIHKASHQATPADTTTKEHHTATAASRSGICPVIQSKCTDSQSIIVLSLASLSVYFSHTCCVVTLLLLLLLHQFLCFAHGV